MKPATRRLVKETALRLGYRPNPMVTELTEHIRTGKEPRDQGSIAILIDVESDAEWRRSSEAYQLQLDGYLQPAERRGYRTECFYLRKRGMSDESVDRILYTRGYSGIILAGPDLLRKTSFTLKWERYAVASVSHEWDYLSIDRASSDHRQNVSIAFDKLVKRGYERIGLALPPNALNPLDSNWLAGYFASQYHLSGSSRIPVFVGSVSSRSASNFRRWHDRWRPDALLCLLRERGQAWFIDIILELSWNER